MGTYCLAGTGFLSGEMKRSGNRWRWGLHTLWVELLPLICTLKNGLENFLPHKLAIFACSLLWAYGRRGKGSREKTKVRSHHRRGGWDGRAVHGCGRGTVITFSRPALCLEPEPRVFSWQQADGAEKCLTRRVSGVDDRSQFLYPYNDRVVLQWPLRTFPSLKLLLLHSGNFYLLHVFFYNVPLKLCLVSISHVSSSEGLGNQLCGRCLACAKSTMGCSSLPAKLILSWTTEITQ